jgi:hypothetical protein
MATIHAILSTAQWTRAIQTMGQKAPIAMNRALNRTATSVRAAVAPVIARDIGLKVGWVKDELKIHKSSVQRLRASVSVRGARVPLIQLMGPEPSRGKGTGVRYRTSTGRGHIRDAFIGTMRSGHRGVYKRTSKARLPIQELFGVSLPFVFHKHLEFGMKQSEELLAKNIEREFRFVMGQS